MQVQQAVTNNAAMSEGALSGYTWTTGLVMVTTNTNIGASPSRTLRSLQIALPVGILAILAEGLQISQGWTAVHKAADSIEKYDAPGSRFCSDSELFQRTSNELLPLVQAVAALPKRVPHFLTELWVPCERDWHIQIRLFPVNVRSYAGRDGAHGPGVLVPRLLQTLAAVPLGQPILALLLAAPEAAEHLFSKAFPARPLPTQWPEEGDIYRRWAADGAHKSAIQTLHAAAASARSTPEGAYGATGKRKWQPRMRRGSEATSASWASWDREPSHAQWDVGPWLGWQEHGIGGASWDARPSQSTSDDT